jgi:hypothetical protein
MYQCYCIPSNARTKRGSGWSDNADCPVLPNEMYTNKHSLRSSQNSNTVLYKEHFCMHIFLSTGSTAPVGPRLPRCRGFAITFRHTTVRRAPLDEWSARRTDRYLTMHNTHKRQKSMPPGGFKPAIPAGEWPQNHGIDRAATGTCTVTCKCRPLR